MLNLAQAGDNIVSSTDLYGGTWTLFAQTLKQFGIETRFVDPTDPENFRRATDAKTRAYYAEILPNPKLNVFPIREVADIGRSFGVPLIADNTATPLIARPLEHGAAVVVYSATKYIGGHGNSIGGLIVDGGNFPWEQHADRFPLLTEPDDAYHGAIWIEAAKPLGPIAYSLRARVKLLRDIGASLSPFNAFLLLQGLETLPLRLRQHNENAIAVATSSKTAPDVCHVIFPGLQTGESRRRADAYLKGGYGALVGFELKGGVEAGQAVHRRAEALLPRRQHRRRALARHPSGFDDASATDGEDQLATGVTPGYVRLSIGIEHPEDIIGDLAQALDAAGARPDAATGAQGRVTTSELMENGVHMTQKPKSQPRFRGATSSRPPAPPASPPRRARSAPMCSRRRSPRRRRKSASAGATSRPAIRRSASASPRASTPSTISTSNSIRSRSNGQTVIQALATGKADAGAGPDRRLAEAARTGLRRQAVRRLARRLRAPVRLREIRDQGPRGPQGQDDRHLRHGRVAADGAPGLDRQGWPRSQRPT